MIQFLISESATKKFVVKHANTRRHRHHCPLRLASDMSSNISLAAALGELEELTAILGAGSQRAVAIATLGVGRLYASWSARDTADGNGALASIIALMQQQTRYHPESYPDGWAQYHRLLPPRERDDALVLVRSAIEQAREHLADHLPEAPSAPSSLSSSSAWSLLGARMGADGYWRSRRSGRVVFGHSYNKLDNFLLAPGGLNGDSLATLTPTDAAAWSRQIKGIEAAVAPQRRMLRTLGANLVVCHLNPSRHLTESLTLNTSSGAVVRCLALLALGARGLDRKGEGEGESSGGGNSGGGMRVIVQVANDLPEWAYRKHPGLKVDFESDLRGREHASLSRFAQHDVMCKAASIELAQRLIWRLAVDCIAARSNPAL